MTYSHLKSNIFFLQLQDNFVPFFQLVLQLSKSRYHGLVFFRKWLHSINTKSVILCKPRILNPKTCRVVIYGPIRAIKPNLMSHIHLTHQKIINKHKLKKTKQKKNLEITYTDALGLNHFISFQSLDNFNLNVFKQWSNKIFLLHHSWRRFHQLQWLGVHILFKLREKKKINNKNRDNYYFDGNWRLTEIYLYTVQYMKLIKK